MAKSERHPKPVPNPNPADHDLDPSSCTLEKFRLFETRARFYLIGSDREKRRFRVLKIDRSEPSELGVSEDPVVYSEQEVKNLLQRIAEGNRATGGLSFVTKVYGIAGCIKFLESYYLILVTKRRQIGSICGHAIYAIDESQMITVPHSSVQSDVAFSKTELRYKKLLSSVDLTKDFFFSYTYPIMCSLQQNVLAKGTVMMPYENMFVWNAFLTQPIRCKCNNTMWTIALVHGHFKQVRMSVFGREFSVALISRRSRHFAGTRYLKRGVNDRGRVANDVETEQIVFDEEVGSCGGKMSSVVQMRGSIPLFWSQEASRLSPKPDIILQRYDPTYQATKLHFEDLAKRYGNPIIVLNLIKTVEKRPREMMLRREFASAVGYLNQILPEESQLKFIHWDFHKFAKSKSANVLAVLGVVASEALDMTGFYYSGKPMNVKRKSVPLSRTSTGRDASLGEVRASSGDLTRLVSNNESLDPLGAQDREKDLNWKPLPNNGPRFQSGVLRTNCIDCLDRTNVAQNAYGLAALGRQLHAMSLTDIPKLNQESSIATALMDPLGSQDREKDLNWKPLPNNGPRFQSGVLRTNCIDCLDRTNVAQYAYGLAALGRQLHAMSLTGIPKLNQESSIATALMEMYLSMGDALAQQYGGSAAHNTVFPERQGRWKATTQSREFLKSIKRYYSNTYTDGEKQDAINFSIADPLNVVGTGCTLSPTPGYKQDFQRMKLTSFDALIDRTCSSIKNVRLCCESDVKVSGAGNTGMAPDAAEVQLKSPNWLFGQRKYEETAPPQKVTANETVTEFHQDELTAGRLVDMNWISSVGDEYQEDYQRYLTMSSAEADRWYGGTLIYDQDESSEAFKHYAELCQGPAMEPFDHDPAKEKHYADALSMGLGNMDDDAHVEAEMEAALRDFDDVGADLGISCSAKALVNNSILSSRWTLGKEKVPVTCK
ncbi:SAC domain-containing protein [Dioscorea alata]|uniref:SAC domain-containing protein n=1 Tax=Dioscorea alata TaxID=55571 RepID=A0ACB7WBR1_DIOAL|nr:SAC domain-containing protein [Dioscorea alata]